MISKDTKNIMVTRQPQGGGYVPGFNIQGKWLLNLGFNYRDIVTLTMSNGSIQITKVQEVGYAE